MTPEEMRFRAIDLFKKNLHWSQAVLAVCLEKMNIKDESAVKAVGAYAGGIAATGNVCGIMLGGVAMASCLYSRGNLDTKEDPRIWSLSRKFITRFEEMAKPFGGINCSDITGVDWQDKTAVKRFKADEQGGRQRCIKLVGDAAHALGELLEKEEEREK